MPTRSELIMMQALPLEIKVAKTKLRIREFVNQLGESDVCVAFSGGKDSTALAHIVRGMYPNVPLLFSDTGLEFPELRQFVKTFDNVIWVKPSLSFKDTIIKHGYPLVSKRVSGTVIGARNSLNKGVYSLRLGTLGVSPSEYGLKVDERYDYEKTLNGSKFKFHKYRTLLDAPFLVGDGCCSEMKKKPMKKSQKQHGLKPIIGTLAVESELRTTSWLKNGCNSFRENAESCAPLSFWTEQDILQYIKLNNLPVASVYGDLVCADKDEDGNALYDLLFSDCEKLEFTGCQRTGCVFCGFGAHLDKGESRFEMLKRTHPSLYNYCINGGAFDPEDGLWKPNSKGLGMGFVFDWCNDNIKNFKIRY